MPGLTIDNLLSVDMVLADGSFVTADADHNADLFWCVRGGGGNFGVVTSFTYPTHPVSSVFAGPTFWPMEQAAEVLKWYREFMPEAPEELNGFFAFLTVPPVAPFPEELRMKKVAAVVWCCQGSAAEAEKMLAPVHKVGKPAMHGVQQMPYPAVQSMFDGLYPPGHQWYWRADFVKEISDEAVERHIANTNKLPTPSSTMHLYPVDGAASRVGKGETPWAYRDAKWAEVIVGVDPDPASTGRIRDWTVSYWEDLHPYLDGGSLRQLHDGRGAGQGEGDLPREPLTAGDEQTEVRPDEPVPRQPEHKALDGLARDAASDWSRQTVPAGAGSLERSGRQADDDDDDAGLSPVHVAADIDPSICPCAAMKRPGGSCRCCC